jgi:monothiol glutaredoxin
MSLPVTLKRNSVAFTEEQALEKIKQDVAGNKVCLFMKGTPDAPQCGFSAHVVSILSSYKVPFHAVNVLEDWNLREGIKKFANWPTIPQLYVGGAFVGGCDITVELHRKGELGPMLEQAKANS